MYRIFSTRSGNWYREPGCGTTSSWCEAYLYTPRRARATHDEHATIAVPAELPEERAKQFVAEARAFGQPEIVDG